MAVATKETNSSSSLSFALGSSIFVSLLLSDVVGENSRQILTGAALYSTGALVTLVKKLASRS